MTALGHRIAAVGPALAIAVLLGPEAPVLAVACFFGCIAGGIGPDVLEVPAGGYRMIEHRTTTHCLLYWLLALGAVVAEASTHGFNPVTAAAAGFLVGGITHLYGDALTPSGIPLWHPYRRWSANLARAGGFGEAAWIASCWALAAASVPLTQFLQQPRLGT